MRSSFVWLVVVVAACGSSSSKDPSKDQAKDQAKDPAKDPAAAKPAEPAAGSDAKNPCELLRPLLAGVDREALDHDPWTMGKPEPQKMMALDEGVAAAIGVCVADHWSEATIHCILDAKDGTAQDKCGLGADEGHRADAATEAVYTRIFGPKP
ncbi:MAG TPA: hypothetical protein VFP84_03625 [Kofleriaceae bacterium]|nr:hypothetical protein [Kofleriaceae bacterium]